MTTDVEDDPIATATRLPPADESTDPIATVTRVPPANDPEGRSPTARTR
ncbi:hypothetical protein GRX01_06530 [Halobaculum sp. WSA2]|uniref:Uncharacterized protein n=1 Tax=Halobaculum saliterrae TaxID=2073113 RepID=A0A6B0SR48_9EURY|nr:hypothetical protein [Halobaculum saliterrae]MXR40997.1 hypothetical protein [Halobaculum saliterrae]